MRFSVTHPMASGHYHPELATGAGIATLARAAEAADVDGYGFTDHPAPSQRWLDSGGHDALDPFVAMSFVAAVTTTIRLIPNIVVLPYRNPFVVAKACATLDVLSGGRFTLAAGVGYLRSEFAALGVDPDERSELFDEALEVLRAVWTSDEVTFEGRHFRARKVTARPRPLSRPHPPIWIGGNSAAARRRVAMHGDGWAPFPATAAMAGNVGTAALETPGQLAAAVDDLRARLVEAGRDPASIDVTFVNPAGGNPASADFDPATHLAGLDELAAMGVTWVQIGLPGDGLGRAVEAVERYGEQVIAVHRSEASGAS